VGHISASSHKAAEEEERRMNMASRDQSGANSIKLYLYSLSSQGSTRDGKPIAIVKGMGWPEFLYKVRNRFVFRNLFVTQYQRLCSR